MKTKKQSLKKDLNIIKKTMQLIHGLDPYFLPFVVLHAICETARFFISLIITARILDELLNDQHMDRFILYIAIIIGSNFILKMIADYLYRIRFAKAATLRQKIHAKISEKVLKVDFEYIDNPILHNLRQKYLEYDNMSGTVYQIARQMSTVLSAIVEIVVATSLSVALFRRVSGLADNRLTHIINSPYWSIFMAMAMMSVVYIQIQRSKAVGQLQMELMEKAMYANRIGLYLQHDLYGNYSYGKDLRMYDTKDLISHYNGDFVYKIKDFLAEYYKKQFIILSPGTVINGIFTGFIYAFVVLKAYIGAISIGNIMKYVGAIQRLSAGISNLLVGVSEIRVSSQYLDIIHQILELEDIKYHGTIPVEKRADHEYEIEFRDVSFKYPGTDTYVLEHISLKLNIGERLAIVGMNGTGKTTFIKLLSRLYDPTEGVIYLNGIDIKKYDYEEYMSLFSVVFQDFSLFSFEMGENIATSSKYDEKKVMTCLNQAGLTQRMATLPKGIHTYLSKDFDEAGIDFSGGELQKMAISRALYKNAPIIILDEPTAALDPISEYEIYTKFDTLVGNKTAIYISHRLSSCRFCHDIAVFHQGSIVQRGDHDSLLKEEAGKYHQLWTAQAQYYKD